MNGDSYDAWFQRIEDLVLLHSPSGVEAEIDRWLTRYCEAQGVEHWLDAAGNFIIKLSAPDSVRRSQLDQRSAIVITAHKDEIAAIVKTVQPEGRVEVRKLGGSFPWVYGEGVVDLLGDKETISGILSFGSRHVSHESPQKVQQDSAPLKWEDAWIETKCTDDELEAAGIRPGTRMVVGKHRKRPWRLKDYIASYTLDNKASVAILLELACTVRAPAMDFYLVASAKEEVGAVGALYFAQQYPLAALIALEICPLAPEYPIQAGSMPVLLSQDGYGIYDEALNDRIRQAAEQVEIPFQWAAIDGFGSDGSIAMKFGQVPKAACLGFPTQNTHGYEIAHLGAISNCALILKAFCERPLEF
jgi:putative aminopeptidase FrvX